MLTLIGLVLAIHVGFKASAQWPYTTTIGLNNVTGPQSTGTLKLWLPNGATRGILFLSNRSPMCATMSVDTMLRNLGQQYGFGILLSDGGPIIINFEGGQPGSGGTLNHADSIQAGLNRLALQSIPAVAHLPLITFGHSLGSYFSQGMGLYSAGKRAASVPEMVAGVISYHLGNIALSDFPWATPAQIQAFKTLPHLWMNAELEGPEANNGTNLTYFAAQGRQNVLSRIAAGELVHQTVLQGGNHSIYTPGVLKMMALFVDKCISYRVPAGHDFNTGRPQLLDIDRTQGWLGITTDHKTFDSAGVQATPYTAANAASQFWLFDSTYAVAWIQYHTQASSLVVSGTASGNYCPGGAIPLNLSAKTGYPPAADNKYFVQFSSAQANYESPGQAPRWHAIPANLGGFVAIVPDNLVSTSAANTPLTAAALAGNGQYYIRVVGTNPYTLSNVIGPFNVANDASCPQAELFVTHIRSVASPVYTNILCSGRDTSLQVTVVRHGSGLQSGNDITIQLSDALGSFANATILTIRSSTLPLTVNATWKRDTISVLIPTSSLPEGDGYRIRAVSSNPVLVSTTNGSDIIIRNCSSPLLALDQQKAVLTQAMVYPNPASEEVTIKWAAPEDSYAKSEVQLFDKMGRLQGVFSFYGQEQHLNVSHLPKGIYWFSVSRNGKHQKLKLVK